MVQVNTPITARIKFKKIGGLQYISHLDLVRTMHKIIVRANLPIWYTEGFNPKPKMVFAAPLSIGTESYTEYMDLRLTDKILESEIMERLNLNLTDEMQVTEVYYPETKLSELKWLDYTISIKTLGANESLAQRCKELLESDIVEVEKKSKPGEEKKLMNIAPLVKSAETAFDGENIVIDACLSGDQSMFLNPEYVVKALVKELGILSGGDPTAEYYSITRNRAYFADMSEFR